MPSLFQKDRILSAFVVLIACSIQIQLTFFQTESYAGIRLNITDIALPIAGLLIGLSLLLSKSRWPQFYIKYLYLWLALLTVIILGSFLHGYFRYGELNQWALINKTVGWLILCSYFLMGAWLIQNTSYQSIFNFIKYFILSFIVITFSTLIMYMMSRIEVLTILGFSHNPFSALMGNKNSYIFLYSFSLIISFIWNIKIKALNASYFLIGLLPLIFVTTGSRMLLATLPILTITCIILKIKIPTRKIFLACSMGALILPALHFTTPYFFRYFTPYIQSAVTSIQHPATFFETTYHGDQERLNILDTTINMIKERPITGYGLASAQYEQTKQWGTPINIIDNTPLWLWAETGIFGLLGFLFFYWLCLQRGWRMSQSDDNTIKKVGQSLICLLVVFGLMSLLHEILYTRFLWLILGMCLVYPAKPLVQKLS